MGSARALFSICAIFGAAIFPAFAVEFEGPADLKVRLDLEIRERPEWRTNADFNSDIHDNQLFIESRIRLGLGFEKGPFAAYIQPQDSRRWGSETSTISNEANLDLHQGFLDWNHVPSSFRLRAGRQELAFGEERLVGALNWNNIGRSFDGVRATWAWSSWSLDGFWARVAEGPVTSTNQDLAGIYATILKDRPATNLDLYTLWLRDGEDLPGEVPAEGLANTSIWTAGARLFGAAGLWSYGLETAAQWGDRATDSHSAWALASQAGYTFRARVKPYVGAGFDAASGDGDPADGESEEFENLFPTNHGFYGYMDYAGWRNIEDLYARFRIEPVEKLTLWADFHDLRLQDSAGRWSNAAGATIVPGIPGGAAGSELGQEIDLTAKWSEKDWTLQGGVSRFFAGEVPANAADFVATSVAGDDSDWAYVYFTLRF